MITDAAQRWKTKQTDASRRGITLVELLVAIFILLTLGWALVQLLSSGLYTWETGETQRTAYQNAQLIFECVARDLSCLYPCNPPMPDSWSFQADTLFSTADDGTGHTGPAYTGTGNKAVQYRDDNILLVDGSLRPRDPAAEAWVEYRFTPPMSASLNSAILQPKISLMRSTDFAPACRVIVEAARDTAAFQTVTEFTSGLRDQVITPDIDLSGVLSGTTLPAVRLRIVPEPGKQSNARLFEARQDDPLRPVFRFACSTQHCQTGIGLVSDYCPDGSQYLAFVISSRGLKEVAYFLDGETLYRAQRDQVGGAGSLLRAQFAPSEAAMLAKGITYFGVQFPRVGGGDQLYWREADSVPPHVQVTVTVVPVSGAKVRASLASGVSASAITLTVDATQPFALGNPARQFVKVDQEWIGYGGLLRDRFTGCGRGQRGTVPAPHTTGALVRGGDTLSVRIPIPAWGYRQR